MKFIWYGSVSSGIVSATFARRADDFHDDRTLKVKITAHRDSDYHRGHKIECKNAYKRRILTEKDLIQIDFDE